MAQYSGTKRADKASAMAHSTVIKETKKEILSDLKKEQQDKSKSEEGNKAESLPGKKQGDKSSTFVKPKEERKTGPTIQQKGKEAKESQISEKDKRGGTISQSPGKKESPLLKMINEKEEEEKQKEKQASSLKPQKPNASRQMPTVVAEEDNKNPKPKPEEKTILANQFKNSLSKIFLAQAKNAYISKQFDFVTEFRTVKENGKAYWINAHFIVAIDCSGKIAEIILIGSMRGARWRSIKLGYRKLLGELNKMENIIISTFSFDEKVNEFIKAKKPSEAILCCDKIPYTQGEETNYSKAFETIVDYMQSAEGEYQDYCKVLIFISDGGGEFPKESLDKIYSLKKAGMKIVFHAVTCGCEEEPIMLDMAKTLLGQHFKIINPEVARNVFVSLL